MFKKPYLETLYCLAFQGWRDSIDNTVVLCPNCHRKMPIVNDLIDVSRLMIIAKYNGEPISVKALYKEYLYRKSGYVGFFVFRS